MKPECSSLSPKEPAIGPYSELVRTRLYLHSLFPLKNKCNIVLQLMPMLQIGLFLSDFSYKMILLLFPSCVLYVSPILLI